MHYHRRAFLGLWPAAAALSLTPSVTPLLAAKPRQVAAALLVPLTGASASLGLSMQRAAALVQPIAGKDAGLMVFDTAGSADGAAIAAGRALKAGAALILGPVFGGEVRATLAAVGGRVPVLCFSNDDALRDSGAFLLGVTASQSTTAILAYARRRGIRRIAMLRETGAWATQAANAAARAQAELGIELLAVNGSALATLRDAAGGLPDALFVANGGEPFAAAGRALQGSSVQLLGTLQTLGDGPTMPAGVQGAWIAAPDPGAFAEFARTYEERNGSPPGAIAALAYDGSMIVKALRNAARMDRGGLLQTPSFPGVTGALRFRDDGSANRQLAILTAEPTGYSVVPT